MSNKVYMCFPGGKFKCLTMSYDDGRISDRRLVEIFNRNGVKGTFNLNSGTSRSRPDKIKPEEFALLYAGHEVACHTVSHPTLERCPLPSVLTEILDDRRDLEDCMGYPIRGLAYPNGSYHQDICNSLAACGIRYGRTVESTGDFRLPSDFTRWHPTCHHGETMMELGKKLLEQSRRQHLFLMYVWGHSWEFDQTDSWQMMEDFCAMMGGRDDVWYATNIQIVDAVEVYQRLQFSLDNRFVYNPSAASAWISVNDGEALEIPGGRLVSLE